MHVYGISGVHGAQGLQGPHRTAAAQQPAAPGASQPVDQLEISAEARQAAQARNSGEIRQDRVAAIREAIANGTYETEAKLSAALDRLLDEII